MCGIVYIKRKDGKPAARAVRKRYAKQKHRGTAGFGYVAIKDNEVVSYKRATTEHEIMLALKKETAPEILFHHRFPTSTPNMEEQSHPLLVSGGGLEHQYFVAHNGVIRNAHTRKSVHDTLGFKYTTELTSLVESVSKRIYRFGVDRFNDSEALAVDTALALEGKEQYIESEGPSAVVGLKLNGTKVIDRFFYRNRGNPLKYSNDSSMTVLASMGNGIEVEAINVYTMEETGEVQEHPAKIWTPWVYRDTNRLLTSGPSDMGRYDSADDWNDYVASLSRAVKKNATPIQTIQYDAEDDADVPKEKDALLAGLPIDTLWDEWDRLTIAKKSIEDALALYDRRTEDSGLINDGVLKGRAQLQGRLDRINAYEQRLTDELEVRSARGEITLKTG